MIKLLIILLNISSFLFPERGDLISFEYKEEKSYTDVQDELDNSDAAELNPNAIYDIKLYHQIHNNGIPNGDNRLKYLYHNR